jgi:hypothetical protein
MTTPTPREALLADHETIWLQAKCADHGEEGRQWCQDDVWSDDCGCGDGHKSTQYIRADLVPTPEPAAGAVERARQREWVCMQTGNPCGTDTRPAEHPCDCIGCAAHQCVSDLLAALASVSAPPGWVMVPVEPTEEMLDAVTKLTLAHAYALHAPIPWEEGYRAMIAASVKP